jgi:hypothetical protein
MGEFKFWNFVFFEIWRILLLFLNSIILNTRHFFRDISIPEHFLRPAQFRTLILNFLTFVLDSVKFLSWDMSKIRI